MPGTMIARGNILYSFAILINITPAQTAANTTAEQTFSVLGLQTNDQISAMVFQGAYSTNIDWINARCVTNNVLTVAFQNPTGSGVTAPSGSYVLEINRLEVSRIADLPPSAG